MELEGIRENIDKIDDRLKELFKERMDYSEHVVQVKAECGDRIYKPEREEDMIGRLLCGVDENIVDEYAAFLKSVVRISRKYQYKRLIELGQEPDDTDSDIKEGDRLQLIVQTGNIAEILSIIFDYGIKVLKINSADADGSFYIDIAADGSREDIRTLIYQLKCETEKCVVM